MEACKTKSSDINLPYDSNVYENILETLKGYLEDRKGYLSHNFLRYETFSNYKKNFCKSAIKIRYSF